MNAVVNGDPGMSEWRRALVARNNTALPRQIREEYSALMFIRKMNRSTPTVVSLSISFVLLGLPCLVPAYSLQDPSAIVGSDTNCSLPIPLSNVECNGLHSYTSASTQQECMAACCR